MCYDDLNAADNLAAGGALANKCLQFQFLLIILLLRAGDERPVASGRSTIERTFPSNMI